jgi:hypothetical protein
MNTEVNNVPVIKNPSQLLKAARKYADGLKADASVGGMLSAACAEYVERYGREEVPAHELAFTLDNIATFGGWDPKAASGYTRRSEAKAVLANYDVVRAVEQTMQKAGRGMTCKQVIFAGRNARRATVAEIVTAIKAGKVFAGVAGAGKATAKKATVSARRDVTRILSTPHLPREFKDKLRALAVKHGILSV